MNKELVFVTEHCCVRVIKEAQVLHSQGWKIHLVTANINRLAPFESVHFYRSPHQLKEALRNLVARDLKMFVVHNEPSWPVVLCKQTSKEIKIVMDMHDSYNWRIDRDPPEIVTTAHEELSWYEEDVAVELCDGFIVPSTKCAEELRTRVSVPVAVCPSAVPMNEYLFMRHPWRGGLVSEGGHISPEEANGDHWRDYTHFYKALQGKKQVWIYSASITGDPNGLPDKHYNALGCKMAKMGYRDLIKSMGSHSWNLVGNWDPLGQHKVWDYALPNKFFDGIAAGVPPVICRSPQSAKLLDMKLPGAGIVVESPEELLDRWGEHHKCRTQLMLHRENVCMEKCIHNLTKLYEEVHDGESTPTESVGVGQVLRGHLQEAVRPSDSESDRFDKTLSTKGIIPIRRPDDGSKPSGPSNSDMVREGLGEQSESEHSGGPQGEGN